MRNLRSITYSVVVNEVAELQHRAEEGCELPYFLAHKTHRDFFIRNFRKNNDECIFILVIYWQKTGLLRTKISNHNIIYSSQKPRKLSSLPLKSSSWLFSLDTGTGIHKFGNNTYPRRIRRRLNLGHIFWRKKCVLWARKYDMIYLLTAIGLSPSGSTHFHTNNT